MYLTFSPTRFVIVAAVATSRDIPVISEVSPSTVTDPVPIVRTPVILALPSTNRAVVPTPTVTVPAPVPEPNVETPE